MGTRGAPRSRTALHDFADRVAPGTARRRSRRRESNPHERAWQARASPVGLACVGAESRNRTGLSALEAQPFALNKLRVGGTAGYRPRRACLQGRRAAFRTIPWQVRRESNPLPRFWRPRCCLSSDRYRGGGAEGRLRLSSAAYTRTSSAPRTRIELVSLDRQSSCDTSRITRLGVIGRNRTGLPAGHIRVCIHCTSTTMLVWDPRIELGRSCAQGRRRTLHHVPGGRSSSSRTSLSPSSAERCHRVSCRGIGTPCRLRSDLAGVKIRRPPRSRTGQIEPASRFELDLRRYECRVFPERAGDHARRRRAAARAGFEPAVGRLTAACVSASPPGSASRRARRVARDRASPARPFELSKIAALRRAGAPGPSPRVVSSRVELDPSA